MLSQYFYHKQIRKYVTVFGTVFNELTVERTDANNAVVQAIKVPISYGPKERALVRTKQDSDLDRPYQVSLPRMSFEITAWMYDSSRHHQTTNITKQYTSTDRKTAKQIYNPVPWNLGFALYVWTKTQDEAAQIIEQIVPYLTPDLKFTVNLIQEMEIK